MPMPPGSPDATPGRRRRRPGRPARHTAHKAVEARLDRAARHDPLTGLINRGELLRLLAAIDPHDDGPHVAVIFLDLDGFKLVNDTRGHQVGDELLVAVARRIRAAVRPEDSLARLGGDEFVVLCPRLAEPADARAVAERVRATLDPRSASRAADAPDQHEPGDLPGQVGPASTPPICSGRPTWRCTGPRTPGATPIRIHSAEMDEELAAAEQLVRDALGAALAAGVGPGRAGSVAPGPAPDAGRAGPALPADRRDRHRAARLRRGTDAAAGRRGQTGLPVASSCPSPPAPGSTGP